MLPILALILTAVLAVGATGIDVFTLYWAQAGLQRATDAGALAGAVYLNDVTFNGANPACSYPNSAQTAACTYALNNGVALSEINSITVAGDSRSIVVTTSRIVPATFARLLGYTQFTVTASGKAGVQALNSAHGVVPIGLDYATPYTYGQTITMHQGGCGSGCWGGLALPSTGGGSTGAAVFKQNLGSGCNCTLTIGDTLTSEPGATNGPINQGVSDRTAAGNTADPSGTWSNHSLNDARAATVVLTDWHGCSGSCTVTVKGFAEVWITNSSGTDINAIFIRQIASGTSGSGADYGAVRAALMP